MSLKLLKDVCVLLLRERLGPERRRLVSLGAGVIHAPILSRTAGNGKIPLIPQVDWVVFTSSSGVETVAKMGTETIFRRSRFAAVGPGTSKAMRRFLRRDPDFVPTIYTTRVLARELPDIKRKKVLLVRSANADQAMDQVLRSRGALVTRFNAYGLAYRPFPQRALKALAQGSISHIFFGSRSQVEAFAQDPRARRAFDPKRTKAMAIGPEAAAALRRLGFKFQQAKVHTFDGLIDLLLRTWKHA